MRDSWQQTQPQVVRSIDRDATVILQSYHQNVVCREDTIPSDAMNLL